MRRIEPTTQFRREAKGQYRAALDAEMTPVVELLVIKLVE